jgi:hypothetical protein
MESDLVLVSLNEEQITKAKKENGKRKQITHALVVGTYGIMFGTEKQCRKYYSAWRDIFKHLFGRCHEANTYDLNTFTCSGNVVLDLIAESDRVKPKTKYSKKSAVVESPPPSSVSSKKKGLFTRLFGA